MIYIDPSLIVGKKFTAFDPKTEYICLGYGETGTSIIVGAINDTVNNRFEIKTFKLSEVKFFGQL